MAKKESNILVIPHEKLKPDTLYALVEEFVTREGTDYGESEVLLQQKIEQVVSQIRSGKAVVVFDSSLQTCNIILKRDMIQK
jgi:uncharacterized protein YheU (UPF0270 family)